MIENVYDEFFGCFSGLLSKVMLKNEEDFDQVYVEGNKIDPDFEDLVIMLLEKNFWEKEIDDLLWVFVSSFFK